MRKVERIKDKRQLLYKRYFEIQVIVSMKKIK